MEIKIVFFLSLILVFVLGFGASKAWDAYNKKIVLALSPEDVSAPADYLDRKDILILDDRVVIFVNNTGLSSYGNSGSMVPTLDENSNGITIVPSLEDIKIGDIISYRLDGELVVHRVIGKGVDGQGTFFVTKGDNSDLIDEKVRLEQIEKKIIGILY